FVNDVPKYARNPTLARVMRHCIEAGPHAAGERIKFEGFGQSNYKSREAGEGLRTLERAMLLYLLYPSTQTAPPFEPDCRKSPRLQLIDTGLVNFLAGAQRSLIGVGDLGALYRGRIIEQAAGQELLAAGSPIHRKPLFWVREKGTANAEVDFVAPWRNSVLPVEVKSGPVGKLKSLHQFIERTGVNAAVRLHASPIHVEKCTTPGGARFLLINLPYYLGPLAVEYADWAS
ncbi:MAG: DUF4143 domain-containing protein, partial [Chitinivibrionales bacterium]|nr:DUF4143 domain-containing protein [Chitinivibrionales bacterium]